MGVLPFIGMVGLVIGLIMLEPDLGTAVMIAIITGTLFFVAGARLVHVLTLAGTTLAVAGVLIVSAGYRIDRILAFTSAESDPMGVGFHTLQLLVAFGSGGLTGLGLGVSRQKFFYVYGAHTDGVLAIMGEELGFVGVMVVLALFLVADLAGRHHRASALPTRFGSLLATGIVAWIGFQMLMNVGGVTRLIPLTGIPLPFLSYGGSALAATLFAVGRAALDLALRGLQEARRRGTPTRGRAHPPARARPRPYRARGLAMKFALAGGGTGGHAYPAIAVAERLREVEGADLVYYGTERGPEHSLAVQHDIPFRAIAASQVRGRSPVRLLRGTVNLCVESGTWVAGSRWTDRRRCSRPAATRPRPSGRQAQAARHAVAALPARREARLGGALPPALRHHGRVLGRRVAALRCRARKTVVTGYPVRPPVPRGHARGRHRALWPRPVAADAARGWGLARVAPHQPRRRARHCAASSSECRSSTSAGRTRSSGWRESGSGCRTGSASATTSTPTPRRWPGRWRPRTSRSRARARPTLGELPAAGLAGDRDSRRLLGPARERLVPRERGRRSLADERPDSIELEATVLRLLEDTEARAPDGRGDATPRAGPTPRRTSRNCCKRWRPDGAVAVTVGAERRSERSRSASTSWARAASTCPRSARSCSHRGHEVTRLRPRTLRVHGPPRGAGRDDLHRATPPRNLGKAELVVTTAAAQAGQPRAGSRARAAHARHPARRDGAAAARGPRRARGRRDARQDHDDLPARADGRSRRPRPAGAARRRLARARRQRARWRGQRRHRRGGRVRRGVPPVRAALRAHPQHRGRPPRLLRHRGAPPSRRSRSSLRVSSPAGRCSSAPTRRRPPRSARNGVRAGARVERYALGAATPSGAR